jgi:hypothetical protein
VRWCVYDPAATALKWMPSLDCETPGHSIQAPFRSHRYRGIYAGYWLIRKRAVMITTFPNICFSICFTVS